MKSPPIKPKLVKLDEVKPHEGIEEQRLSNLTADIKESDCLIRPIAIDQETKMIIDGHHRVAALKRLECFLVPIYEFNYHDPNITVLPGRQDLPVDKSMVISAALRGAVLPSKSTHHLIMLNGQSLHISDAEHENPISLKELRQYSP